MILNKKFLTLEYALSKMSMLFYQACFCVLAISLNT